VWKGEYEAVVGICLMLIRRRKTKGLYETRVSASVPLRRPWMNQWLNNRKPGLRCGLTSGTAKQEVELKYINVLETVNNYRVENKVIEADCHIYEQYLCDNFVDISPRIAIIITTLDD
jgi:hypothetical protein